MCVSYVHSNTCAIGRSCPPSARPQICNGGRTALCLDSSSRCYCCCCSAAPKYKCNVEGCKHAAVRLVQCCHRWVGPGVFGTSRTNATAPITTHGAVFPQVLPPPAPPPAPAMVWPISPEVLHRPHAPRPAAVPALPRKGMRLPRRWHHGSSRRAELPLLLLGWLRGRLRQRRQPGRCR